MSDNKTYTTTAKEIYDTALSLLGYTDDSVFQKKAIACFNKVYFELHRAISIDSKDEEGLKFSPITSLSGILNLPKKVLVGIMPLGIAEQLALSQGDGEQQQYFAAAYERAKAKLNRIDAVSDTMP